MEMRLCEPVAIALDVATRDLEQTVGTVVGDDLLCYTPRTADLVTLDTVEEVLERVEAEVGTRSSRVKGGFVVVVIIMMLVLLQGSGGVIVVMARKVGRI